MYLRKYTILPI